MSDNIPDSVYVVTTQYHGHTYSIHLNKEDAIKVGQSIANEFECVGVWKWLLSSDIEILKTPELVTWVKDWVKEVI